MRTSHLQLCSVPSMCLSGFCLPMSVSSMLKRAMNSSRVNMMMGVPHLRLSVPYDPVPRWVLKVRILLFSASAREERTD